MKPSNPTKSKPSLSLFVLAVLLGAGISLGAGAAEMADLSTLKPATAACVDFSGLAPGPAQQVFERPGVADQVVTFITWPPGEIKHDSRWSDTPQKFLHVAGAGAVVIKFRKPVSWVALSSGNAGHRLVSVRFFNDGGGMTGWPFDERNTIRERSYGLDDISNGHIHLPPADEPIFRIWRLCYWP